MHKTCGECYYGLCGYCKSTTDSVCDFEYEIGLHEMSDDYKEKLYMENLNAYEYDMEDDLDLVLHRITGMKY